jgi:hypothetical protein
MPDLVTRQPLKEVWALVSQRRQRVYRGRNAEHVAWKLKEYARNSPEVVEVEE